VFIVVVVAVIIAVSDAIVADTFSWLLIVPPPLMPCWLQAAAAAAKLDAVGVLMTPLPLPPFNCGGVTIILP
jgi:hypothetical protein